MVLLLNGKKMLESDEKMSKEDDEKLYNYLCKQYKNKRLIFIDNISTFIGFMGSMINQQFYFRGFSKERQMYSTYIRELINYSTHKLNKSIMNNEIDIIRKYEDNASIWMKEFNNPVDFVATAQHLGLQTRFKDWTSSLLVATLFALNDNESNWYYVAFKTNYNFVKVKTLTYDSNVNNAKIAIKYKNQLDKYNNICKARTAIWKDKIFVSCFNTIDKSKKNNDEKIENICDWLENNLIQYYTNIKEFFEEIFDYTNNSNNKDEMVKKYTYYYILGEKILIESKISNERVSNQKGLFELEDCDYFYDTNPTKKLISMYKNNDAVGLIVIKKEVRNKLIEFIAQLGITYQDLMKDASSVARLINDIANGKKPKTW